MTKWSSFIFSMFFCNIGFQLSDILVCIQWMQSFVTVTNRTKLASQKTFKGVSLIISVDNHCTCTYKESYMYLYLYQCLQCVCVYVCVAPVFSAMECYDINIGYVAITISLCNCHCYLHYLSIQYNYSNLLGIWAG